MTADTYVRAPSRPADASAPSASHAERSVSLRSAVAVIAGVDLLVAGAAVATGLSVRFGDEAARALHMPYVALAALFPAVWVLVMAAGGAYTRRFLAAGTEEYRRVLNAGVWMAAALAIASFSLHLQLSRGFVGVTVPLATVLTLMGRHLVRRRLHGRLAAGGAIHRVVVVGPRADADRLTSHINRSPFAGYRVLGTMGSLPHIHGDDPAALHGATQALLGDLVAGARRLGADTIAVASGDALGNAGIRRLCWELEGTGIRLMVVPNVADIAGSRIGVRTVAGLPMLHIEEPRFTGGQRALKACIDRAGAAVLLLAISPVLAAIAVAALISQGRPLLYRQERVGLEGARFTMTKFRTMRNGADTELAQLAHLNQHDGEQFKIRDDPRITRLGSFLRRHSLDELPQLLDVMAGSMSLVGPRPPLASEVARYGEDARRRRLLVKPGMTGLWQVSGRSDLAWDEAVRLDLHYIDNWSVAMDMMLLWKTASTVLRPRGAY